MIRDNFKIYFLLNVLIFLLFLYPAIQTDPIDYKILVMGLILILENLFLFGMINLFRPDADKLLIALYYLFISVGISTLVRINPELAIKQLIYSICGFIILTSLILFFKDFKYLFYFKWVYCIVSIFLCLLPLFFGVSLGGAKNWISFGGITIQPSEFARISLVMYLACELKDKKYARITTDIREFFRPLLISGVCACLLVKQNDLGAALLVFLLIMVLVFVTSSRAAYPLFAILFIILVTFLAFSYLPHFRTRVESWKDPWACSETDGYQVVQGFYSIASGGLVGNEYSEIRSNYVPVCESDYIFSIICEEHGILFGVGLIILSFFILLRCLYHVLNLTNRFLEICILGFSVNYFFNVLLILGGILSIIPLTGVTYPLVSAGGSSLLATTFSLGLISKFVEQSEVF